MAQSDIQKAKELLHKKRYSEALSFLEPKVLSYKDDFDYYYLMAYACMHVNDLSGSQVYLNRCSTISPFNTNVELMQAALCVKKGSVEKAIQMYLSLLEQNNKDTIAQKGLDVLREHSELPLLQKWLDEGNFFMLIPKLPFVFPVKKLIISLVSILIIFLVSTFGYVIVSRVNTLDMSARPEIKDINLSDSDIKDGALFGGSYRYVLSEADIEKDFNTARKLFSQFRDNLARVYLNKLVMSNAKPIIKEKARSLLSFTQVPTFTNVLDRFSYKEVSADPFLYSGCAVIWKGRITNYVRGESSSSFDFLVDYESQKQLSGIVKTMFTIDIAINSEKPIEILALIIPDGNNFILSGVSVHELQ